MKRAIRRTCSACAKQAGRRAPQHNDESGAVMILALVFLVVVALIVTALLTWVGTSLTANADYANERATEAAATSAVNLAIQNSRYSFSAAMVNASPPVQCWGTSGTSSVTVDNVTVDVWCSMSWLPFSVTAQNRNITYSACVVPVNPTPTDPVPTATSCAAAPLLQALVSFDDPPGPGGGPQPPPPEPEQCTPSSPPTYDGTCGQSLTQDSWQWNPVVPSVTSISAASAPVTALSPSGSSISMTVSGNGFVPGATVNFVQETGPTPGPGVSPTTPNVPTTPPNQGQGVIVPATVTANSVSCSGPNNTNCTLQVTVPPVTSGIDYFVTVATPGGTSAYQAPNSGPYNYVAYTPVIPIVASISGTTAGSITGGTTVTINGPANGSGGFYSAPNFQAQVLFCTALPCITTGANPTAFLASHVQVQSSSTMTALSPQVNAPSSGTLTYFVQVDTIGGSSINTSDTFVYGLQVPIIFSLSPVIGGSGTTLTINGFNFLSNSSVGWVPVSANDQNATPTNVVSATTNTTGTQIKVTVPTLPTTNTTYIPVIMDPSPYLPPTYPWSQPYNESADEFAFTH
jgi:hypothetical protein